MSAKTKAGDNMANWKLIRSAAVLQVKLLVDGFRDLALVPASLIAALLSLVARENGRPGPQFDRLIDFGRRTESWIDLFGTHRGSGAGQEPAGGGIDDIVERIERFVADEYRDGGLTRQARERLERILRGRSRNDSDDR